MTVVDHPLRQVTELNQRVAGEVGAWPCWKTDLLWDSYLTLEFGPRKILSGKNGPAAFGEFRMLLDEAPWWVERDDRLLFEGDDVVADLNKTALDKAFIGRQLVRIDWREHLSAVFSDGIVLNFYQPEDAREQLLELRFPNSDCVDLYADGRVETESMAE